VEDVEKTVQSVPAADGQDRAAEMGGAASTAVTGEPDQDPAVPARLHTEVAADTPTRPATPATPA
jgi:hypothetical protein